MNILFIIKIKLTVIYLFLLIFIIIFSRYFSEVRELEPYRDTLMELYSTSLWHQQKEVALSALAQDMTALDRNSSSTWCVVGNCFSLQKEHQTAIKYFQRAIQVNIYINLQY